MDPPAPHPHPRNNAVLAVPRFRSRPVYMTIKSTPQPVDLATRGDRHQRDARTIQDAMQSERQPTRIARHRDICERPSAVRGVGVPTGLTPGATLRRGSKLVSVAPAIYVTPVPKIGLQGLRYFSDVFPTRSKCVRGMN